MRFRFGILDLAAAITVLVVILLPARELTVTYAYAPDPAVLRDVAWYQARLATSPGDGEAADELSALLTEAGQSDWAVQVAGEAARHGDVTAWRALLAASGAHAMRFEIRDARRLAEMALAACDNSGDACPSDQRVRLDLYFRKLDAGVKSGIDPRQDPARYQLAEQAVMRVIQIRGSAPETEDAPEPDADDGGRGGENRPDTPAPSPAPAPAAPAPAPAPANGTDG